MFVEIKQAFENITLGSGKSWRTFITVCIYKKLQPWIQVVSDTKCCNETGLTSWIYKTKTVYFTGLTLFKLLLNSSSRLSPGLLTGILFCEHLDFILLRSLTAALSFYVLQKICSSFYFHIVHVEQWFDFSLFNCCLSGLCWLGTLFSSHLGHARRDLSVWCRLKSSSAAKLSVAFFLCN